MSNGYIVFGASGGIGSTLARHLATQGNRVLLVGRSTERLQALAAVTGQPYLAGDATRFEDVDRATQLAVTEFGSIHGVANCVGSMLLKPAHTTSEQEWADTVATNLTSAFAVVRSSARAMMSTGGSIVLVSSVAASLGLPNHEAIAAAKAGVEGLTRSAAATYAPRGIRVNAVAPALTRTPMTARIAENEAAAKASIAMHPLGRLGEPTDIVSAIAWLLDPAQSWVTGQVLGVDGGLSTVRGR